MVPISDANPTRRMPVMNFLLIGINLLVFLYELQLSNRGLNRFVYQWGLLPSDLLAAIARARPIVARTVSPISRQSRALPEIFRVTAVQTISAHQPSAP